MADLGAGILLPINYALNSASFVFESQGAPIQMRYSQAFFPRSISLYVRPQLNKIHFLQGMKAPH